MAYFKPYVDETGYHFPTYNEILEYIVQNAYEIFGQGLYLGNDAQDYQMFSTFARAAYDSYCAFAAAYDAHSPRTSVGAGLDAVVSINGIRRKEGTRSVATVTIEGTPDLVIKNGSVADNLGRPWDLPEQVIIGLDGKVDVTATSRDAGQIIALANTITAILTPMRGWTSVTNSSQSESGSIVETDAQLRARQAISVAQPSASMMEGLKGAIASVDDVTRYVVYENDTNVPDQLGISPHSICAVVEGGTDQEIARILFNRKSTGCGTYGATAVNVVDAYGANNTVYLNRPTYVDIDVEITIRPLQGFVSEQIDAIKGKLVDYLDTLTIGDDLTISVLWWAAQEALRDTTSPTFSVTSVKAARHGLVPAPADIILDFQEVARGNTNNIIVILT